MDASTLASNHLQPRPSPETWIRHKEKIITLYTAQQLPLKDVQHIMTQEHGFVASKREYETRFKKWGVSKNLSFEQREETLRRIRVGEDAFSGGNTITNLNRRLRRHKYTQMKQQDQEHQRRGRSRAQSELEAENIRVTTPFSDSVVSNTASSNCVDSLSSEDCSAYQALANSQYSSGTSLQAPRLPTDRGLSQTRKNDATIPYLLNTYWDHELLLLCAGSSQSISPQPTADPKALNLSLFLRCVRDFAEWSFQTTASSSTEITQLTHPASEPLTLKIFWQTLNNCIYLYKINDLPHATSLLSHLLSLHPTILLTTPSLDFLQRLLASFSPINFRRNPPIRLKLLTHLHTLLSTALGPQHLLATICHQMLFDNDTRHATETALSCLHSSLVLAHDSLAFQTERAIIALLRRDGCLDDAARKARTLFSITRSAPDPDCRRTREAAQELAHVYMDTGQLNEAKELCHEYSDPRTLYALENLAKIEEQLGNWRNSATWLWEAAELARKGFVGGGGGGAPEENFGGQGAQLGGMEMVHVVDKLRRALRFDGREGDARAAERIYASFIPERVEGVMGG
ncbi:hypothetical protein MMC12_002699 [Toensbergia leucococca]|nr:hypothetical protein [Toensbergia leucococca]